MKIYVHNFLYFIHNILLSLYCYSFLMNIFMGLCIKNQYKRYTHPTCQHLPTFLTHTKLILTPLIPIPCPRQTDFICHHFQSETYSVTFAFFLYEMHFYSFYSLMFIFLCINYEYQNFFLFFYAISPCFSEQTVV